MNCLTFSSIIILKEYFAQHTEASIALTFQDVETIEKRPLPSSARKDRHFWYHRKTENGIAEAWRTEGYSSLKRLAMGKEKITFHRDAVGASKLVIPAVLMNSKLPYNVVYELERHMEYIINKYGLIEWAVPAKHPALLSDPSPLSSLGPSAGISVCRFRVKFCNITNLACFRSLSGERN